MNDGKDNLRGVYKTLKSEGYNPPDFEQFAKDMEDIENLRGVYSTLQKEGYTLPDFDVFRNDMGFYNTSGANLAAGVDEASNKAQQQAQRQAQRNMGTPGVVPNRFGLPTQQQGVTGPVADAAPNPQVPAQPLSFQERVQKSVGMAHNVGKAKADFSQRMSAIEQGNKPLSSGKAQQYDPTTGETKDVYYTTTGQAVTTPMERDIANIDNSPQGRIGKELEDAYAERDRLEHELSRRSDEVKADGTSIVAKIGAGTLLGLTPAGVLAPELAKQIDKRIDPQWAMLNAAKRANDKRIAILERDRDRDGFFRTVGKTLFDIDTWDFGANEIADAVTLSAAADKKLTGKAGEAQEALMRNTYLKQIAEQRSEDDTFMQRAGDITANVIPFVLEFILTGGGYAAIGAAGRRLGAKSAAKIGAKGFAAWTMKNTGTLAGNMLSSLLMANTTGLGRTAADIMGRHQGVLTQDENGDYVFRDGKSWGRSVYEGEMAQAIEYFTEHLGNSVFDKALGKWVYPTAGKLLTKGLDKLGASKASEIFSRMSNSQWAAILDKCGIQGYPSEVLEEGASIVLNSLLVGDNQFSDLWNRKTLADILGGMALSIGFMQAPDVALGAYNTAQYYRFKHNTDKSDQAAAKVMGEQWEGMRDLIDSTPNEGMQDVIEHILDSPLPDDYKATSVTYAYNLMKLRGYNLRTAANAKDRMADTDENGEPRAMSEEEAAVNEAFANGYEADEQQRSDISIEREDNPNDPQAQAAWDGVQQRIADDAEDRAEAVREAYKPMTREDGSIHPVTLNVEGADGQPKTVYLIDGSDVVLNPDGSIDREKSSPTLMAYDPEQGKNIFIYDPYGDRGIQSVGEVTTPEALDQLAGGGVDGQGALNTGGNNGQGARIPMDGQDAHNPQDGQDARNPERTPGAPEAYTPGMVMGVVDNAGQEHVAEIVGRVRFDKGKFVPDENGMFVEYTVDGQTRKEAADKLNGKVRWHETAAQPQQPITAAEGQQPTAGQTAPQEGVNDASDTRTPAQRTYDDIVAKLGADRASHKIDATAKVKADRLAKAEKALKTAQETADNTEYGSKEEQKAEAAVVKAQAEYEAAQQDMAAWEEVRKLRDQALIAQSEAEDAARKAERDRRLAEESEAQRKQREAYAAEQARRKAEAEAAEKRRQEENERLRQQAAEAAANPQPAEPKAPIEGTKGQASQLEIARQELSDDPGVLAMLEDIEPRTLEEVAAHLLSSGKNQVKLQKDDFMRNTGYGPEDVKKYPFIFAGKEKGGITIARLGEMIESEARDSNIPFDENDAMAGVTAALNMLGSVGSQGDINGYIAGSRIQQAYDYHNAALAAARANLLEAYGMTEGEYESYMSWLEDAIEQGKFTLSDEEFNQLFNVYEQGQTTDVARGNQEGAATTERTESAETDTDTNGERGNGETDAGTGEQAAVSNSVQPPAGNRTDRVDRADREGAAIDLTKVESLSRAPRSLRGAIMDYALRAFNNAEAKVPAFQFGVPEEQQERMTYEKFRDEFGELAGDNFLKGADEYLRDVYDYIDSQLAKKATAQDTAPTAQAIAAAEAETDTNPTEGQKEAGNYKKGHVRIDGYDITIEQPKGSVRRGTDKNGRAWEQVMHNTYGYIRGTESLDGDHIDVFLSDDPTQGNVYVVDQVNEDGTFDEHKVMYGFPDMESARQAYLSNYEDGWRGLGTITPVSKEEFKKWIESSHRKTKPFSEYKRVKTEGDVMVGEGIKPAAGQSETWDEHVNKVMEAYDKEYAAIEKSDGERLRKEAAGYSDERLLNTYIRNAGISQIFGKGREGMRKFIGEEKNFKAEKLDEVKENNLEAAPDAARQSFVQDVLRAELDRRGIEHKEEYTFAETSEAEDWYKKNVEGKTEQPRAAVGEGGNKEPEESGKNIADVEAGGAIVDKLEQMGVEVSADIAENRRVRKQAENDKSENGKIHELRTTDGKVYGFAYRGKLYLDPRKIDAELPLHEYAHLWTEAMRMLNPKKWAEVVEQIKQDKDAWQFIKSTYPDLKTDSEIADEVIATFSGKNGADKLKAALDRFTQNNPDYKSRWNAIYNSIAKALQDFWKAVGDFLNIKYESAQQIYDQVLKDFVSGMNPRARVEKYLQERETAYMQAAESGDVAKATEIFNQALSEEIGNGMTPFIAVGRYDRASRIPTLAHKVKSRDPKAIDEVAELIAPIIPKNAVLVPAPSHNGRATDMLDLAKAIAKRTGSEVADVLTSEPRESQYETKKRGGLIASQDMGITMTGTLPEGKIPVVIDNVVGSGNTAEACVRAIGKGLVVSLGDAADRYNHAVSLKSAAPILRDRNNNIVPLSKRFELGGSQYLGRSAYERADGKAAKVSAKERRLRDAIVDLLRKAGIDVVTESEEGQRVLDMANGRGVTLNKAQKRILETAPLIQEEGSRADISSIDGAKVLKNLDILAEKLEKSTSDRKNFLQEVGNALNAKQHGSKSQYATFETKNGQIVTIRLGNHNATVSRFDNNGEDNGISIVISRRANQGIINDGNAHLVEYFYSDKALNRAEGKPLADIVRSIKQALYSGEYNDTTGLAEREEVNAEQVRMHRVYHGSGTDFEHFNHSHMGEGEGNQSFGWGTYVTEVEGIGKKYANDVVGKYSPYQKVEYVEYVGEKTDTESLSHAKAIAPLFHGGSRDWNGVLEFLEQTKESPRTQRHIEWFKKTRPEDWKSANDGKRILYTVEIPEDNGSNYLEWDKKASDKQTEAIKNALMQNEAFRTNLRNEYDSRNEWTDKPPFEEWLENVASVTSMYGKENGKRLYNELSNMIGSEQAVSEFLHSAGFVGIKYPAEYFSGGRSDGAKNYVIFDEGDLQITDKVKFFRTESGEAYGFTMGGKIYLDPKIATAETPIHEYTHLWAAALRAANPKAWEQLKSELTKDTELMAYVQRLYPELAGSNGANGSNGLSDELAEEVFAHFSGRRGAERLREEQRKAMDEAGDYVEKAGVVAMFERLRDALKKFWNMARDLFAGKTRGIKSMSAEDFADMVLGDLLNGVKPDRGDSLDRSDRERDAEYIEAVESGDMEKAQRMVNEAAKRAMPDTKVVDKNGNPKVVYHQTANVFTVFNPRHHGAGTNDNQMPFGVYLKPTDKNIGVQGEVQMALYADIKNPLRFANRTDLQSWLAENVPGYKEAKAEYDRMDGEYTARFDELYNDDGKRYDELWERLQNGEIGEEEYQRGIDEVDSTQPILDEWHEAEHRQSAVMKKLVDEYMHTSGFDGIVIENDEGSFGRSTTTILAFEPEQVKSADPVTYDDAGNVIPLSERFNSGNADIRYQRGATDSGVRFRGEEEPVFYSNAMRAVENIKQEKATPEQWLKMIEKAGGLKAGEDKWLGLSEWLRGLDGRDGSNGRSVTLTKQEVLDYIRANRIEIEEVEYSEGVSPNRYFVDIENGDNNWTKTMNREVEKRYGWNEDDRFVVNYMPNEWFSFDIDDIDEKLDLARKTNDKAKLVNEDPYDLEDEEDKELFISEVERELMHDMDSWTMEEEDYSENNANPINETRLQYTTEGLENKREIALTVPTVAPWNEGDEIHFGDAGEGRAVAWVRFGETTMPSDEQVAAAKAVDDYLAEMREKYGSAEGEETDQMTEDEIEHLQSLTSVEAEAKNKPGKRVLVIDEIQSKRHQEGREKGYRPKELQRLIKARQDAWEELQDYNDELEKKGIKYPIERSEDEQRKHDKLVKAFKDAEKAQKEWERVNGRNAGDVPDAPFDKNWHEVAMKRMLRYAAENGYDKVAWTKGEQQAERYDLSTQVKRIRIARHFDELTAEPIEGEYEVYLNDKYDVPVVESNGMTGVLSEERIKEVYGKDLGQRMIDAAKEKDDQFASFEGNDLRIGGEGMKGFYDQILPRFMDKYGKKWGVKTGEVELPNIGDNGLTMWSVDVTDDMRESVMRGQPLFRPKTQSREGGEEAYAGEWYDRNSVERIGEFAGYTPKQIAKMNARQEESARKQFNDTAEKLHLSDNITFADSIDDVPGLTDKQRREWRRKKGWYSPRTGKIVIILGNHKSMDDVMKSILHEGVAHHGLRQMFGKHFDTFLDNVYQTASPWIRDKINDMAKKHGWDFREATEEYLAMLAEDTDFERPENQSWWKQVKAWFFDMLHKIGFKMQNMYDTITDNELRYILWRSYENLVNPGRFNSVVEEAKDIAKQYELKVGQWDETWTVAAEAEPNATMEFNGRRVPIWATNGRRENRADSTERDKDYEKLKKKYPEHMIVKREGDFYLIEGEDAKKAANLLGYEMSKVNGIDAVAFPAYLIDEYLPKLVGAGVKVTIADNVAADGVAEDAAEYSAPEGLNGRSNDNRERFKEILDNSGLKYRDHLSYKNGSRYFSFSIKDKNGDYNTIRVRVSDHAQPKEWRGNYEEGVNDFRNYADAYNYLSKFFDLSDKRNAIAEKRKELAEQIEEIELNGEKAYRIKGNDAVFSTPEAAISNVINSDFVPRMTGQLVDEFAEDGVRFRDGDFTERDEVAARDYYERMVSSSGYQFREAVQDSMLGLRKAYEAILGGGKKFRIEEVPGNENAYLAENRMSSVNAAEQHNYFVECMKPLLEEIHKICGSDKALRQELTDYMMAKHGLERNRVFAERDAQNGQNALNGQGARAPQNGQGARIPERDYAGLTALTGMADVHDAELAAMQMVADFEARHDVSGLWAATKQATGVTLAKIYLSGMLSKESYEQIRDQFEWYIPLQGFDETTSDEVYGYLTSKKGPFGSPIKHAEGRSSKADDPIATIGMMADMAIRQANRNEMKKLFLNFVLDHPSDLVSVNRLWLQYDDVNDEWVPVFADIEEGDTAADVERKVAAFEERMEQLAAAEPDKYKHGRNAKNIPYRVLPGNLSEHQVLVKRDGETYVLTINGNPRAAQALNGLTNPDVKVGGVVGDMMKAAEWVNHNLSAAYTTRTPDFVVSNYFRDMLYSNCMTWVKEGGNYALRFHKNFGKFNPATMRVLFGKWEKGTLDESKPIEFMFKQFMLNGGETGYTNVRDIEAHKREIARELKRQGNVPRKAWHALGMQLDLLNRSVENCARFAAFITSQEMGRSVERSIYDAKEVSVNFNKKGSGGKMVNATGQTGWGKFGSYLSGTGRLLYVFWNAGTQGMTNFMRAAKHHPGKFSAGAAAMFALGAIIPLLAKAIGDDDDDENAYYNLPEYVRRSNICFRFTKEMPWITIPLPIEFRAIYGLGELGTGVITGDEHYNNWELARQLTSQVSQILPLDFMEGGGGLHAFIPSLAKPIVEASSNKGWTGLPIYRDNPFNQKDPEFTKVYKNADKNLVAASKWLNELTGGDDYKKGLADKVNPAQVEYVLNGYLGGWFKVPNQLMKMGETAFGDRDFEWRNMMLANRLIKDGDERTANRKLQNEYFELKDEYEETKRLLKKYKNAADEGVLKYAEKLAFLNESEEYGRYLIFDEYRKEIDKLYKQMKEEEGEQRKATEEEYYSVVREMVDKVHEYNKGR